MGFGTSGKPLRVESFDSEDTEIRRAQVLGGELGILYKVLNLESRRVKRTLLCAWMDSRCHGTQQHGTTNENPSTDQLSRAIN